ncbi:MAG TPA: ankyrin repeat domain-containing protein [Opitutales bacterium]|nr:ankyrin repeat domain-containing protein [Opitutales bacterium]
MHTSLFRHWPQWVEEGNLDAIMEDEGMAILCVFTQQGYYRPIHLAAIHGQLAIIEWILSVAHRFPCLSYFLWIEDLQGLNALHHAAMHGRFEVVQLLLEAGANVYTLTQRTHQTAADLAQAGGHTDVAHLLQGWGHNPSTIVPTGEYLATGRMRFESAMGSIYQ